MKTIIRIIMIGTAIYYGYRYRYKLMNTVLSNPWLRKMLVSGSLSLPFMRNQMMHSVFSSAQKDFGIK
ncbi:hypothetical protein I6J18_20620 [Peribacillus psychrosaccharolyticus]|uniref:Uncharacterized protein n=1 Tax=Peribacillus psychrosaccharolyticus TaxID=1407 RepID=A0A974NL81_PERPY|nr:hypothetical protein [Peribacillus psychrosaccharolyticus]MEC2054282.1 hypothetical protein [Peribacillus psychrosaccharolyticus]MED3744490.1 hypothetical protein [Peribacillus psychrosaccharolyticus]QQS99956.1 hypothetical protein I6J18_20620 [Peribacillus psychrosaccharolyticus]